jgi:aryl-alcohol dehydrogenase-like predicted oxidoreductase
MKYRRLGKTNFEISEVSLGTWQLGEAWGTVSDADAIRVLETAIDKGVNFFDTADVYGDGRSERPEVFEALEELRRTGKILFYGVSVEKVEEALKAIEYPGLATVQIIFNIFRQRPKELFFPVAQRRDVGILVRLPLASGLLGGNITRETKFAADDHRSYNRYGERFDRGETFSGVDFDVALDAAERIRRIIPGNVSMADFAMRWILQHDEVSCVIPGARNADQVIENAKTLDLPPLTPEQMQILAGIYQEQIKPLVHHRW